MNKEDMMIKAGELYKNGNTLAEIAKKLDISISTARKYVICMGYNTNKQRNLTENILKLHEEGRNTNEIACMLDCSKTTVLDTLKQNGFGRKKSMNEEEKEQNLNFAEDRLANLVLEKVIIDGIYYEDITPLLLGS